MISHRFISTSKRDRETEGHRATILHSFLIAQGDVNLTSSRLVLTAGYCDQGCLIWYSNLLNYDLLGTIQYGQGAGHFQGRASASIHKNFYT